MLERGWLQRVCPRELIQEKTRKLRQFFGNLHHPIEKFYILTALYFNETNLAHITRKYRKMVGIADPGLYDLFDDEPPFFWLDPDDA